MKMFKYLITLLLLTSSILVAQEAEEAPAPTNLDKPLELVKEGKTKEQAENDAREAEFKSARDGQREILRAEQRELARQERFADELEDGESTWCSSSCCLLELARMRPYDTMPF